MTRRHTRIKYPAADRPLIRFLGRDFTVIDLSESGAKFQGDHALSQEPALKTRNPRPVDISIKLLSGTFETSAVVVRQVGDLVMINFSEFCPRDLLASEYDRLQRRFGHVDLKG